jgi:hypothetical protein
MKSRDGNSDSNNGKSRSGESRVVEEMEVVMEK